MRHFVALASVLVLGLSSARARAGENGAAALSRVVPRLMQDGEVPGLSIVLMHDSKIACHRSYGFANAGSRIPLTDRSVFESASLTKPVFAYAVLRLSDAGVLSLDAPIGASEDPRITARMVL
jgi:CubicO group peptidase (beta-lactamase class C family)